MPTTASRSTTMMTRPLNDVVNSGISTIDGHKSNSCRQVNHPFTTTDKLTQRCQSSLTGAVNQPSSSSVDISVSRPVNLAREHKILNSAKLLASYSWPIFLSTWRSSMHVCGMATSFHAIQMTYRYINTQFWHLWHWCCVLLLFLLTKWHSYDDVLKEHS